MIAVPRLSLLAVVLLSSTSITAQDGPRITPDVVYGHKDGMALTFDVIAPQQPNGAAVLWLQSGGWYSGWQPPQNLIPACTPLMEKGLTLLIVRHGSAPRFAVPDAVGDVRRCVRYVHQHAEELGLDVKRLGVLGGSAGGHLTLMLATTGDDGDANAQDETLRFPSRITCGVALYPPTDLRGWTTDPPAEIAKHAGLKPPLTFSADLEDDVSPLLQVSADDAPVLMIHGDKDVLVPIEHAQKILPEFEKVSVGSELITIEGAGHGFTPEQNVQTVGPAMVGWFEKHLCNAAAP